MVYLCFSTSLFSQESNQIKLDSLQKVLVKTDLKKIEKIVNLGNMILRQTSSNRQKYEVNFFLSEAYTANSDIEQSIVCLFKAKEAAEKSGDPNLRIQSNGAIAGQYGYLGLTKEAHKYLNYALKEIQNLPDGYSKRKYEALVYMELGNNCINDSLFEKANINFKKSLAVFRHLKDTTELGRYRYQMALYNLGTSYYHLKAIKEAEYYLNKSLTIKQIPNSYVRHYAHHVLGEIYTKRKEYRRSIDTIRTVLVDSAFNINVLKVKVLSDIANNYKCLGDSLNYSLYNKKHNELKNTADVQAWNGLKAVIDMENKNLALQVKHSNIKMYWLIGISGFIIVCCALLLLFILKRRKKERQLYVSIIQKLENDAAFSSQNVVNDEDDKENRSVDAESRYIVSSAVEHNILEGLQKFELEQGFRDLNLSLSSLAGQLKTNPAYLSAVIRAKKGNNFNGYINELRIRYICIKLHENPEYLNYKISYLAEDCGFISHSAFSIVFKKVTGISPSAFIKEASKTHLLNK